MTPEVLIDLLCEKYESEFNDEQRATLIGSITEVYFDEICDYLDRKYDIS